MLLASKIAGNGLKNTSLYDLFEVQKEPQVRIQNYYACFGSPNEVENILSIIYKGLTLDKCTVAVANSAVYSQLFFDYSLLHNIPFCTLSINSTFLVFVIQTETHSPQHYVHYL